MNIMISRQDLLRKKSAEALINYWLTIQAGDAIDNVDIQSIIRPLINLAWLKWVQEEVTFKVARKITKALKSQRLAIVGGETIIRKYHNHCGGYNGRAVLFWYQRWRRHYLIVNEKEKAIDNIEEFIMDLAIDVQLMHNSAIDKYQIYLSDSCGHLLGRPQDE